MTRIPTWAIAEAFAALVAATILGAASRAGTVATVTCETPQGAVQAVVRDAVETPDGWVVRTTTGRVVVARDCRRTP